MIPNYSRKMVSGWSNYSGMVKSQKMNESKMGDRGSKSNNFFPKRIGKGYVFVKEQRVDGNLLVFSNIRYTLKGLERDRALSSNCNHSAKRCYNFHTRHPSKQYDWKKYSTLSPSKLPNINPTLCLPYRVRRGRNMIWFNRRWGFI